MCNNKTFLQQNNLSFTVGLGLPFGVGGSRFMRGYEVEYMRNMLSYYNKEGIRYMMGG